MFSKSGISSLALALGVAGMAAFASATPAQAAHLITLRACNHTNTTVLVGASYIPEDAADWLNKGWTPVGAGQCKDIFKTTNRTFYARAEVKGDSDSYWGADIKQCVEYPGPYNFYTHSEDTSCPEGEPAEFTTFHSDGSPVYVWNLNPSHD